MIHYMWLWGFIYAARIGRLELKLISLHKMNMWKIVLSLLQVWWRQACLSTWLLKYFMALRMEKWRNTRYDFLPETRIGWLANWNVKIFSIMYLLYLVDAHILFSIMTPFLFPFLLPLSFKSLLCIYFRLILCHMLILQMHWFVQLCE